MRIAYLFIHIFLLPFFCMAQVPDTVYVDEVDTILVNEPPVIINKTVYVELPPKAGNPESLSMLVSGGFLLDLSHYDVCETCQDNFNVLISSSSYNRSLQYGLQVNYSIKKISIGIDLSYRLSSKHIHSSQNSTVQLDSRIRVHYFMAGPSLGYKLIEKRIWDVDIYGGVLFSFTTSQKGQTLGGEHINTVIDLSNTALISKVNFLYHFAPTITYKLNHSMGISLTTHYYFDQYSNVTKQQSYTEQRNTLGISLGINYLF